VSCEVLYRLDALGDMFNTMLCHRLISEGRARMFPTETCVLVISPGDDAIIRSELMHFTPEQLTRKGTLDVNPFDRVSRVDVSLDLPRGTVRLESASGVAEIFNLTAIR
jgi:hypothetical protein